MGRSANAQERFERMQAVKEWAGVSHRAETMAERALRSDDNMGHVPLKSKNKDESICPSKDFVEKLLNTAGSALGVK